MKAFLTTLIAFAILFGSLDVATGKESTSGVILAQIDTLLAEKKATAAKLRRAEPQIQPDIERTKVIANVVVPQLEKQKQAVEQFDRDVVYPACSVTVSKEQYAAAKARCDQLISQRDRMEADYDSARAPVNAEQDKILARLQYVQSLLDTMARIDRDMKSQKIRLELAYHEECIRVKCSGKNEATVQCLQQCWDGAKARAASDLQRRGFSITPNI